MEWVKLRYFKMMAVEDVVWPWGSGMYLACDRDFVFLR